MPTKLNPEIISAAVEGFEAQKRRIDAQIAELRAALSGSGKEAPVPAGPPRRKSKMSASARERIAAAQRKRWAEAKRVAATGMVPTAETHKRKLSAAARKRIVEANRKRWAMAKAAAKRDSVSAGQGEPDRP